MALHQVRGVPLVDEADIYFGQEVGQPVVEVSATVQHEVAQVDGGEAAMELLERPRSVVRDQVDSGPVGLFFEAYHLVAHRLETANQPPEEVGVPVIPVRDYGMTEERDAER